MRRRPLSETGLPADTRGKLVATVMISRWRKNETIQNLLFCLNLITYNNSETGVFFPYTRNYVYVCISFALLISGVGG